jgi:hypothetical protein
MNDATIIPRLVSRNAVLGFQHDNGQPVLAHQSHGRRQAHDPTPDHGNVDSLRIYGIVGLGHILRITIGSKHVSTIGQKRNGPQFPVVPL